MTVICILCHRLHAQYSFSSDCRKLERDFPEVSGQKMIDQCVDLGVYCNSVMNTGGRWSMERLVWYLVCTLLVSSVLFICLCIYSFDVRWRNDFCVMPIAYDMHCVAYLLLFHRPTKIIFCKHDDDEHDEHQYVLSSSHIPTAHLFVYISCYNIQIIIFFVSFDSKKKYFQCRLKINKDKKVRNSKWHIMPLSPEQQIYAAIDVYVSSVLNVLHLSRFCMPRSLSLPLTVYLGLSGSVCAAYSVHSVLVYSIWNVKDIEVTLTHA